MHKVLKKKYKALHMSITYAYTYILKLQLYRHCLLITVKIK